MSINFAVKKKEDRELIRLIAKRANELAAEHGVDYPVLDAVMDLTAVHANDCPLRLKDLLAHAETYDFAHDVMGIRRHLNRITGKLEDCFCPRFAV